MKLVTIIAGSPPVVPGAIDVRVLGEGTKGRQTGRCRQDVLTEVEMDLARTKKELAEVKMERDIQRTLPRSRAVRGDE